MSLLVICPKAAQIADIIVDNCPTDFGQIQRIIFQRKYSTGTTLNTMPFTNAKLLATWTALLQASDSTKAQISDFIADVVTTPGDAITFGSGNAVVGGIPMTVGTNPTNVTMKLYRPSAAMIASLKLLQGEDLAVTLVDEHGRLIMSATVPATPVAMYPIPIREFFVGDRKIGGFEEPDYIEIRFSFFAGWSNTAIPVVPSFNPLSELAGT